MAQNKQHQKRKWGTGSIIPYKTRTGKTGYKIRWNEKVLGADGKPKRRYPWEDLGEVSEAQAQRTLIDRIAEANRKGVVVEKAYPTFAEHVERWRKDLLTQHKYSTEIGHYGKVKSHFLPLFGTLPVDEISPQAVQQYFTSITPKYRLHSLVGFREAFRDCMKVAADWYKLPQNPGAGVKLPKKGRKNKFRPPKEQWYLTPNQAGALVSAIEKFWVRVMVTLALTTDLRVGEILALRWRSLTGEPEPLLLITERYYRGNFDCPKSGPKGSTDNERKIDVEPGLFSLLEKWRRQSLYTKPDDFIFSARGGGVLRNPQNIVNRFVKPACRRLGLRAASWHVFRHTWQTWAEAKGVPRRIIADVAGHADLNTQKLYIEPIEAKERRKHIEAIAADLHKNCTNPDQLTMAFDVEENWVN